MILCLAKSLQYWLSFFRYCTCAWAFVGHLHPSSLTKLIHTTAFTFRTYLHPNYSWWPTLQWNGIMGLSAAAAADILIAVSLVYLLHTRCADLKRTRTVVNKLILYTIETGALTSIFAIIIVILFALMPRNLIFISMEFILPKRKIPLNSNSPYLRYWKYTLTSSVYQFLPGYAQFTCEYTWRVEWTPWAPVLRRWDVPKRCN